MKTPGQKAYEAAKEEEWLPLQHQPYGHPGRPAAWIDLSERYRADWERIAAAVTAPEPKSYGEVAFDAWWRCVEKIHRPVWAVESAKDRYETEAQAVIAEFKRREGLDK